MNGYLVILRCALDDFPVRFFGQKDEGKAVAYAKRRKWGLSRREINVFDLDPSLPCYVMIVHFVDGAPTEIKKIKGYDD